MIALVSSKLRNIVEDRRVLFTWLPKPSDTRLLSSGTSIWVGHIIPHHHLKKADETTLRFKTGTFEIGDGE